MAAEHFYLYWQLQNAKTFTEFNIIPVFTSIESSKTSNGVLPIPLAHLCSSGTAPVELVLHSPYPCHRWRFLENLRLSMERWEEV